MECLSENEITIIIVTVEDKVYESKPLYKSLISHIS